MTSNYPLLSVSHRIVVADANVLYSRVLRDYLLISAEHEAIEVHWSHGILSDMADHLMDNLITFDAASAQRLIDAMTRTFPDALITPRPEHYVRLAGYALPDEDDRDVIATALAAEADIICTNNVKHFPKAVMADLGLTVLTADVLLSRLIDEFRSHMIDVHRMAVEHLRGATDQSTIAALRRAGAPTTANHMTQILGMSDSD